MDNLTLRRQLFLAVRDIPYQIDSEEKDTSCVAKSKLLGELLTRAGLETQIMKGEVLWNKTGIPEDLLKLTQRPFFNHFFIQVLVPETNYWVNVDATWDSSLEDSLPVNTWDGITETQLAYPCTNLQVIGSPFEFKYRNFDPNDTFTRILNAWYQSLRKEKYDRKN